MAGMRKLIVEVISAKGLMPKDGTGSANAYCVVCSLGRFVCCEWKREGFYAGL